MAESGGDADATNNNSNGTTDRGLWQINSIHGSQSTTDPVANARAAVSISDNGTNWRPWCTAWTGPCSGTYQGDSAPYKKFLSGGSDASSGTQVEDASLLGNLNPKTWVNAIFKPLSVWVAYGAIGSIGLSLMVVGFIILVMQSPMMKSVIGAGAKGAKLAGKVAAR